MKPTTESARTTPRSMIPKNADAVKGVAVDDLDYGLIVREVAGQQVKVGQSFVDKGNKLFATVCKVVKSRLGMEPDARLDKDQESFVRLAIDTFKRQMATRVLEEYQFNFKARFDQPVIRHDSKTGKVLETAWRGSVSAERGHKDRKEAKFAAVHHLEQARRRLETMEETPKRYMREDFDAIKKIIKAREEHLQSFDPKPKGKGKDNGKPSDKNGSPNGTPEVGNGQPTK